MKEEMINTNDVAYAVIKDGSVINNFGDADEKDCDASLSKVIEPICYAPYNILKTIIDKKSKSSTELCLVGLAMVEHYRPSRMAFHNCLGELIDGMEY